MFFISAHSWKSWLLLGRGFILMVFFLLRISQLEAQAFQDVLPTNYSVSTPNYGIPYVGQVMGVAVDHSKNLFFSDKNSVWRVSTNGVPLLLAGNSWMTVTNSNGSRTSTNTGTITGVPGHLAVDGGDNVFFILMPSTLEGKSSIIKVTPQKTLSLVAGNGLLGDPRGVALDSLGNCYVSDTWMNTVCKITQGGFFSTVAGDRSATAGLRDGIGVRAGFNAPLGIATSGEGDVYVADCQNNAIRKVTAVGAVTTVAGSTNAGFLNGRASAARFQFPQAVALDTRGNIYVADTGNYVIRRISTNGVVSTIAGSGTHATKDGIGTNASFAWPMSLAVDSDGIIYVADTYGIRKLTPLYPPQANRNIISFPPISAKSFGSASFPLSATASSGLKVSYTSSKPSVATISGSNTVTILGAGTTTITACQAGDSNYIAATPVSQTLVVTQASNAITFVQPSARTFINGGTFALAATAPGGTVSFTSGNPNLLTIVGSIATMRGAGTVTVTACQGGSANYNAATTVSRSVVINKANQTISYKPTTPISFATTKSFTLSGSSTSGLPLSYSSSAPAVISVSGTTASVKAKGKVTITASQVGNANYNAATPVPVNVTVQ